jgi:hypothetical protein
VGLERHLALMCRERPKDCARHDDHDGWHMMAWQVEAAVARQMAQLEMDIEGVKDDDPPGKEPA